MEPEQNTLDTLAEAAAPDTGGFHGRWGDIAAYGMSLQGSSHKRNGTPCQDSSRMRFLEEEGLLVAAIADGVGSCPQSHFGSAAAVEAAIESLCGGLQALSSGQPLKLGDLSTQQVEDLFHTAFSLAQSRVEQCADDSQQPVYNFQSTLTAAIYDGFRLACCHVGDDGIVAQGTSGKYQMITRRMKGEEANSVVTLQSGRWEIVITRTEITGFLMSTDGILDCYVSADATKNRVYYPFFEKFLYAMEPKSPTDRDQAVEEARSSACVLLQQEEFSRKVTDDLTILAAANQRLLCGGEHPPFSQEKWDEETKRFLKEKEKKLHPPKAPSPHREGENGGHASSGKQITEDKAAYTVKYGSEPKPQSPNVPKRGSGERKQAEASENVPTQWSVLKPVYDWLTEEIFPQPTEDSSETNLNRPRKERAAGGLSASRYACRRCRKTYSQNYKFCPYCGEKLQPYIKQR